MYEMKESGVAWMGAIPSDWTIKKLGHMTEIITDGTHYTPNYIEDGVPFLSIKDISSGKIDFSNVKYISDVEHQELYKRAPIKRGDILFTRIGTLGVFVEVDTDTVFDIFVSVGMLRLKPNIVNTHYLVHYLNSPAVTNYIQGIKAGFGTAAPKYNLEDVKKTLVLLPPESVQKKIADYLDARCSEIDALRDDIKRQIDILEQYKHSVIVETVTKGLNPDAVIKDSGIEWVGTIPENWTIMPNKYVMHKVKEICSIYGGEDILSLTVNGVIVRDLDAGGKMPTSFDGYQRLRKGNLLMCLFDIDVTPRCIGLIKNDGVSSPAYSQFVLHDNAVAEYYYYYYLMLDYTKELLHMAKNLRHSLTEEQLGAISVPVPPINEQREIANYLNNKVAEIDTLIEQKKKQLKVLENYKKSLIYEYVTGKKEVPEQ